MMRSRWYLSLTLGAIFFSAVGCGTVPNQSGVSAPYTSYRAGQEETTRLASDPSGDRPIVRGQGDGYTLPSFASKVGTGTYHQGEAPTDQPAYRPAVAQRTPLAAGVPTGNSASVSDETPGTPVLYPRESFDLLDQAAPEGWVNLETYLEETQTGRVMIGFGVNSDAGLTGSFIIDERNFDWLRYPRSWDDVWDFTAFRGGGQRLRLEAIPGTQLQRYMFNFQDPYFLDTQLSLGISGFFFTRRFFDWDEERLGGRFSLGYRFPNAPDLSVTSRFRIEKINILNPRAGAPPALTDVVGANTLAGFLLQLTHDTRDSAFLPTQGHFIELGFEYVTGSFNYPRSTIDMRQHFVVHERPDESGRHVLSLVGQVGVSGRNTPIYEHFFAGGFSTIRGFDFRGASPRSSGVIVGGEFQLLTTVEYMFPLTADDMLRGVVFVDAGTVEEVARIDASDFRVAPGFGLRVTIAPLGAAPLAFDFAFPIADEAGDDRRVFSFFVGLVRP